MIELTNISHFYGVGEQRNHVLRGMNFRVMAGSMIAITGSSGSGKSTLLNIMGCLLTPSSGHVSVMGCDLASLNDADKAVLRRGHLGFIFQSFNLIPVLNALENVEYPLILGGVSRAERTQRARHMLDLVGLRQHLRKRPDQLSGGQKQRVAIARALVASPDFVLADEPTANLDSHTAMDVLRLMADLNREMNTAFIFSTHDSKISTFAQQQFHLEDGMLTG